jgi:hypothetical protein
VTSEVAGLRAALHAGAPLPDSTDAVQVVLRADGVVNHVRVALPEPVSLEDLAGEFGTPRELPRLPSGARRVAFAQTGPREGERTVTVLAELDRFGRVTAVVLRPDDFAS